MQSDPLKLIWDCAELENPVLTIKDLPMDFAVLLEDLEIINALAYGKIAMCDACGEGHHEKVIKERYPDGSVKFFLFCPYGGGRIEVDPEKLKCWSIGYKSFGKVIAEQLNCEGNTEEIIADRLWNLGVSTIPINGMRREIWLVRKLLGCGSAEIISKLPTGRSVLIFSIGRRPNGVIGKIEKERILNLPDFLVWKDSKLILELELVKEQFAKIGEIIPPKKKPVPKRAERATTADQLKKEITQRLISAKRYAFTTQDKTGTAKLLPPPTMQELAESIGVNKSTISRILNDKSFFHTKMLWEACKNIEKIKQFKPKH
jgi:hypothetical protein